MGYALRGVNNGCGSRFSGIGSSRPSLPPPACRSLRDCRGEPSASTSWWMGQVVFCEGPISETAACAYCQLTDVETGLQRWIQSKEVTQVIWALDGWLDALESS